MSLWVAILYLSCSAIIAFINPFWGFISLFGSTLIRFQDRFEVLETAPVFIILALCLCFGLFMHRDKLTQTGFATDKKLAAFLTFSMFGLLIKAPQAITELLPAIVTCYLVYYFASRTLTSIARFHTFFIFTLCILLYMSQEAVLSFLNDPESPFVTGRRGEEIRLGGMGRYANPNEFGAVIVIHMAFLFALIVNIKSWIMRAIFIPLTLFLGWTVILTLSRTCMAVLGIMVMLIAVLQGKGNVVKRGFYLGTAMLGLMVILTNIPGPIQDRINSIRDYNTDESFQGRRRAWEQGFHMAKYNPILGVGINQWGEYHGRASHNTFVQILAETGYIGLVLFLITMLNSLNSARTILDIPPNDPRYDPKKRVLATTAATTLFGFAIYAFFGNQAWTPFFYVYFGVCAGLNNLIDPETPDLNKETKDENKKKVRNFINAPRKVRIFRQTS